MKYLQVLLNDEVNAPLIEFILNEFVENFAKILPHFQMISV